MNRKGPHLVQFRLYEVYIKAENWLKAARGWLQESEVMAHRCEISARSEENVLECSSDGVSTTGMHSIL